VKENYSKINDKDHGNMNNTYCKINYEQNNQINNYINHNNINFNKSNENFNNNIIINNNYNYNKNDYDVKYIRNENSDNSHNSDIYKPTTLISDNFTIQHNDKNKSTLDSLMTKNTIFSHKFVEKLNVSNIEREMLNNVEYKNNYQINQRNTNYSINSDLKNLVGSSNRYFNNENNEIRKNYNFNNQDKDSCGNNTIYESCLEMTEKSEIFDDISRLEDSINDSILVKTNIQKKGNKINIDNYNNEKKYNKKINNELINSHIYEDTIKIFKNILFKTIDKTTNFHKKLNKNFEALNKVDLSNVNSILLLAKILKFRIKIKKMRRYQKKIN